jgi:hypothetical protein
MLVSGLDSIGARDVIRFDLDGIVSKFDDINLDFKQQLIDSAKKVVMYGQKSTMDYKIVNYKNIYGVQIDNPIAALKYFKY